jgi:ABC-type dipeptide/oligopeptide/nickel transport system permease component
MFLQSVEGRTTLMQALFLMITVTVLLAILAADVATVLDPRTRRRG